MINLPGVTVTGVQPEPVKPMQVQGTPGFTVIGGYVDTNERNPKLVGDQKYVTAADILANVSIVAAGTHYFADLVASPEWKLEPADESSEAQHVADFIESCMYDLDSSWHRIIRRASMFRFYGFGVHEWTAKKRDDGKIGFKRIAVRPQHTIKQWDIDAKTGDVVGVIQQSPMTFQNVYLPRGKLVYLVDDTLSDNPEGFGLVRHLAEPADRYTEYKRIEGSGFERDFRGIPVGWAPRAEIQAAVASGQITKEQGDQMTMGMAQFVSMRAKATNTGLLLDSSVYMSNTDTGMSPSATRKWGMELLQGSAQGIEHVGAAIEREQYDLALILGVESLLTGKGGGGSRALSEDKSRNLYLKVNSCVKDIGEAFDTDFIGPLMRLNGLDMKLKPSLKPEDVSFRTVEEITNALSDMATAGAVLHPEDPVVNDVRDLLGVSRQPEELAAINAEPKEPADNGNQERTPPAR
jgi:hypothetical protein